MNKQQTFIIFGVLIILLLMALIFKVDRQKKVEVITNNEPLVTDNIPVVENPTISGVTTSDQFKKEVPTNIVIPAMNDQTLTPEQKKDTAIPSLVVPAAPGSESSLRNFVIQANGGKFIPSQIIGKVGDTMVVKFTAVDQDYSISFPSYSIRQVAKKGETKTIGFHAGESGNFTYFCDICGTSTTAIGNLIIAK